MCMVYTRYHGTSEIYHGMWACTIDNSLAKACGLPLRLGTQNMLYFSLYRLSSSPTFSYFLGVFLPFFLFFLGKPLLLLFLPQNSEIVFLIRKSYGCWRVHHLPYSLWGPRCPPDPQSYKNVYDFWFHFVYFTLFCNIQEKKENMLCCFYPK